MPTVNERAGQAYSDYQRYHAMYTEANSLLGSTNPGDVARGQRMMFEALRGETLSLNRFNQAVNDAKKTGQTLTVDPNALSLAQYQADLASAKAVGQTLGVDMASGVGDIWTFPSVPNTTVPTNPAVQQPKKKKSFWQKLGDFAKKAVKVYMQVQKVLTQVMAVVAPFIPGVGPAVAAACAGMSKLYDLGIQQANKKGW